MESTYSWELGPKQIMTTDLTHTEILITQTDKIRHQQQEKINQKYEKILTIRNMKHLHKTLISSSVLTYNVVI